MVIFSFVMPILCLLSYEIGDEEEVWEDGEDGEDVEVPEVWEEGEEGGVAGE